jgi:hypothetical protein
VEIGEGGSAVGPSSIDQTSRIASSARIASTTLSGTRRRREDARAPSQPGSGELHRADVDIGGVYDDPADRPRVMCG